MRVARPLPAALLALSALAVPADAEANCGDASFGWSDTRPPINLRHVFCGEIDGGRPKGLHSAALASTWTIVRGIERRRDEGGGVYSAIVRFDGDRRKLSTFFPDHCDAGAVVRSIAFAARQPSGRHRVWGERGRSAPETSAAGFCRDDAGRPISIRFARLDDGRVNTAFPE